MKFGVALLRPDTGGADAGVLAGLVSLGVPIGAILGAGSGALTALMYAAGADLEQSAENINEALGRRSFPERLFLQRTRGRREITGELNRRGMRRLSDANIPLYLLVSDKDEAITVITSEKKLFPGKNCKICELSAVSAADFIIRNRKNTFPTEINYKSMLGMNDIACIISVGGAKTGPADYGYNYSFRRGAGFRTGLDAVNNGSEELLKTIFLR